MRNPWKTADLRRLRPCPPEVFPEAIADWSSALATWTPWRGSVERRERVWPVGRKRQKGPITRSIVLYGDLVKAVRRESAQAVAHWWGVSNFTVSKWRR